MQSFSLTPYKTQLISFTIVFFIILTVITLIRPHIDNDEIIYKTLTYNVVHHHAYSLQGTTLLKDLPSNLYATPLFFRPPLFVISLAFLYLLLGQVGLALAPTIIYAFLCFTIYKTALLITQSEHIALKTLLLSLASPLFLFSSVFIHLDTLMTLLALLAFYFLMKWRTTGNLKHVLLAGLLLSFSTLTNYTAVILYPLFLLFLIWQKGKSSIVSGLYLLLPSLISSFWFYPVFGIYHMSVASLFAKPGKFTLTHFPFMLMAYQRPFYFYFITVFLTNPLYLLFFTSLKKKFEKIFLSNAPYCGF